MTDRSSEVGNPYPVYRRRGGCSVVVVIGLGLVLLGLVIALITIASL